MALAWIPITLGAAAAQAVRTALQRHLKARLSINGAAFTRFVFGLPLAAVYLSALLGALGIGLATASVMLMSLVKSKHPLREFLLGWTDPNTLLGLVSGGLFGVAAVGFRAASISLADPSPFVAAAFTLVVATSIQTTMMAGYLAVWERGQLGRVFAAARTGALVGLTSFLGSAGWFTAFTLQIAAYVRTLGLVELVFTLLISLYAFRERPGRFELIGLALLSVSIAMVLNSGR